MVTSARTSDLLALLAVFGCGCNAILGIDSGHPKTKDAGDVSDASMVGDRGVDAEVGPIDASDDKSVGDEVAGCSGAHPPQRPSADDDPMRMEPPVVLAIETLQFEDDGHLGLDIDDRCTACPEAVSSSCVLRSQPTPLVCDGAPDGRDLTGNLLLDELVRQGEVAFSQQNFQRRLNEGMEGALIRIAKYNGRANDQSVTIEFFGKVWMPPPDGGAQPTPHRDGNDTWTAYNDSVVVDNVSAQQDISGYVNDHVLVAHLREASVALRPGTGVNDNPFVVELRDAIVIGRLVPTERGFRLEAGGVVGRWPSDKILKSFSALADASGSICRDHLFYGLLKTQACAALDVMRDRASDNTNKTCDAVSFGIGFTAGPAKIADTPDTPLIEANNCGDDWFPTCD